MEVMSEESKAFANTVFLKKSMYYNMRSRIVKRHAGHVIRKVGHKRGEPSDAVLHLLSLLLVESLSACNQRSRIAYLVSRRVWN